VSLFNKHVAEKHEGRDSVSIVFRQPPGINTFNIYGPCYFHCIASSTVIMGDAGECLVKLRVDAKGADLVGLGHFASKLLAKDRGPWQTLNTDALRKDVGETLFGRILSKLEYKEEVDFDSFLHESSALQSLLHDDLLEKVRRTYRVFAYCDISKQNNFVQSVVSKWRNLVSAKETKNTLDSIESLYSAILDADDKEDEQVSSRICKILSDLNMHPDEICDLMKHTRSVEIFYDLFRSCAKSLLRQEEAKEYW
jgi:hypothetical protein